MAAPEDVVGAMCLHLPRAEAAQSQALLRRVRRICLALPESSEGSAFGKPALKVGKKAFSHFYCTDGAPVALFRLGPDGQSALLGPHGDARYAIPAYMGNHGWISLRLDRVFDAAEVEALALQSYRHFAPKRLLKQLDA